MASRESTGRELSSEWSHHRISSIDSKVRVTLQNPLKHSGSKNRHTDDDGCNVEKCLLKFFFVIPTFLLLSRLFGSFIYFI